MADNRYITTHSNYTIRKKHKNVSGGTIYERDYMTTSNLGGFNSLSIPYGEGNFRIIRNDSINEKRKHKYAKWLVNENCDSGETCEYFTLSDLSKNNLNVGNTSEANVKNKFSSKNLLDYVYYGSCEELVKASINDIIIKFPAELFVTDRIYEVLDADEKFVPLGGEDMVFVSNPFKIDVFSKKLSNKDIDEHTFNELRYFCQSYEKYEVIDKDGNEHDLVKWESEIREKPCFYDGDILATAEITLDNGEVLRIKQFYYDKDSIIMSYNDFIGYHIRPKKDVIDIVFNEFDDFESLLMDRTTKPLYTATFEIREETNVGNDLFEKSYTFPTENGWNLQIEGNNFAEYIRNLLDAATWYDANKTDNLWRNMTHESIKNMDRTVSNPTRDEDNEDYIVATTKLRGLFYAYGRQFDEFKKNIDGIKQVKNMSYSCNNVTPDYLLSDELENSGWEVCSVVSTLDKDARTDVLFKGNLKEYTPNDTNTMFMRELKLNSRELFSRKGTKEGIEMLLSLFGFTSYDWAKKYYTSLPNNRKIKYRGKPLTWDKLSEEQKRSLYDYTLDEYVSTIENTSEDIYDYDETIPAELYNTYKSNFDSDREEGILYGLPVRVVNVVQYDEDGEETIKKYLIPWFNKKQELDGEPYFQMFGGWEKQIRKDIVPNKELYPNVSEIRSISGFTVYDETKKYLKVVDKLSDIPFMTYSSLQNDDIIYVNDISEFKEYYNVDPTEDTTNYFILKDKENYHKVNENVWENITKTELSCESGETATAFRVIYLESLLDDNKGNNPHVGYGKYDGGSEYLKFFKQIFKGAIENSLFSDEAYDCETGKIKDEILNCGFTVKDGIIDNVKCWYFNDSTNSKIYRLDKTKTSAEDEDYEKFTINSGYEVSKIQGIPLVGAKAYLNNDVGFKSELSAFDLETQASNSRTEASANSIINVKNLSLKFNRDYGFEDGFYDYIHTCVKPYLIQMVPSTAIFNLFVPYAYTIRFVNWDGSLLEETKFIFGDIPYYSGETPERPREGRTSYKFVGWEPEIVEVTGEATYKAVYDEYRDVTLDWLEDNFDVEVKVKNLKSTEKKNITISWLEDNEDVEVRVKNLKSTPKTNVTINWLEDNEDVEVKVKNLTTRAKKTTRRKSTNK